MPVKENMKAQRPLWAPWRIEFIRSGKDKNCFLCGKKDCFKSPEEELVVFRGEYNFVIMNRYPYNSGHLMVAPYRHVADISKLETEERHELIDLTVISKDVMSRTMKPDGFNAGLNLGAAAGAGIEDHIHFHIVPRWLGDTNFMTVLGDIRIVPEALVKTAELIRDNWK